MYVHYIQTYMKHPISIYYNKTVAMAAEYCGSFSIRNFTPWSHYVNSAQLEFIPLAAGIPANHLNDCHPCMELYAWIPHIYRISASQWTIQQALRSCCCLQAIGLVDVSSCQGWSHQPHSIICAFQGLMYGREQSATHALCDNSSSLNTFKRKLKIACTIWRAIGMFFDLGSVNEWFNFLLNYLTITRCKF